MKYEIKSKKIPEVWEDGYFMGNGTLGGIVMCNPGRERIIFSHEKLFLHTTECENFPYMGDVFKEVRGHCTREMGRYFYEVSRQRGLKNTVIADDAILYPDSFFPAFELGIWCNTENCLEYERRLDTSNGEIVVTREEKGNHLTERMFVSHVHKAAYVYVKSEEKKNFVLKLSMVKPQNQWERKLIDICIKKSDIVVKEEGIHLRTDMNQGFYCGEVRVVTDGKVTVKNDFLETEHAEYVLAIITVGINEDMIGTAVRSNKEEWIPGIAVRSYEKELTANIQFYQKRFFRSSIEFTENRFFEDYCENLFADREHPEKLVALTQKLYYMGRYLAISSFGEFPPHAQGLWNGNINGRLFCDYISNIELEMALWSVFSGNFKEYALGFFDFIERFLSDFERNARNFFDADGIMVTSRFTNSGLLFHYSPEYTHQFWIAGGAWFAHIYYEYYMYTHDREFLEHRALPFMRKAADFYVGYLADGTIVPSVSPENSPYENAFCMIGKNATMDISVVKELFENIKRSCEILGLSYEYQIQIPTYMYEADGTLKEWADGEAVPAYSHRHLSHCYALMPGYEAKKDKRLFTGIKKAIDRRVENGFYTEGNGTCGWSVMHLLNLYARMENSSGFMETLQFLLEHYVRENFLTCLNYDGTRFQIDANLGAISALYEMLLYSDEDSVVILPALPKLFISGKAENLLIKGNRLVKALVWDEQKVTVRLKAFEQSQFTVSFYGETYLVRMVAGEMKEMEFLFPKVR